MGYVAVKGGEKAIDNSIKLLADERRGDRKVPELQLQQISEQFGLAVDRVMTEGSVYDPELAALALKQSQGDSIEAIFLLRAYRTTLPRFAVSAPLDSTKMSIRRRISTTFKDLPGGQILGATYDYTHRLLDFSLAATGSTEQTQAEIANHSVDADIPSIAELLDDNKVVEEEALDADKTDIFDLSRQAMQYPANRDQRLQNLARADEGFLLGLSYSATRGYGGAHPFVGELRHGEVRVEVFLEELGFSIEFAEITLTECQMIGLFHGSAEKPAQFTRGYGLTFGGSERKAMSMAIMDRSLRGKEFGIEARFPAQNEEFVLSHSDNVEASGFITHMKLPHYVDFQAELQLIHKLREEMATGQVKAAAE